MNLRSYLDGLPRGGVSAFAERVGITSIYLAQLAAQQDGREPSPELCVRIEVASGQAVRRWDLRAADWGLIWPELIGKPGAPAAKVAA